VLKVVKTDDFAGGVAAQRQRQIVGMDAGAVVAHPNQAGPALFHLDRDAGGARVQAVFQQFLDHRGGAFDDLAGGNLTDQLRRQPPDARTHREENSAGCGKSGNRKQETGNRKRKIGNREF